MPFSTIRLSNVIIVCFDQPVLAYSALVSSISVIGFFQRQLTIFHSESVKCICNLSSALVYSCLPIYYVGRHESTNVIKPLWKENITIVILKPYSKLSTMLLSVVFFHIVHSRSCWQLRACCCQLPRNSCQLLRNVANFCKMLSTRRKNIELWEKKN